MKRRVVVTGIGCVTPLGNCPESLWEQLSNGRSGVRGITVFDASTFPVRIAAEVREETGPPVDSPPPGWSHFPRQSRFTLRAADQACRDAGLPVGSSDPLRAGVYMGCGELFPDLATLGRILSPALHQGRIDPATLAREAIQVCTANDELQLEPGHVLPYIAGRWNLEGPVANFTTACVSSSIAIGEAAEVIRRGDADVMLSGGGHSMIHPLGISGFHRLSTLSQRNDSPQAASRPFDRGRDGFVVGEGAAVVVLEERSHALRRGAEIWAEVTGYASTHDAFRISDPRPDGGEAARCIRLALQDARLNPSDLDYINAHGSGTPANDTAETVAVKAALGQAAFHVPMSSTKSMTGHLTTACGALEFLVCLLAMRHRVVPPTINYEEPDPNCDLDYVPNQARSQACRHVMSNSFGFGGQNAVLVLSAHDG